MYKICKGFTFMAAHRLPQVPEGHKCHYVHGHNYFVEVIIESKLNDKDFVIDFGDLKFFKEYLDNEFDHKILVYDKDEDLLNLTETYSSIFKAKVLSVVPTCERLSEYFAKYVKESISDYQGRDFTVTVRVWESSQTYGEKTV